MSSARQVCSLFLVLAVSWQVGCIELKISGEIRHDNSGELEFDYIVVKEFFHGKYSELDKNNVLPLDEQQIQQVVSKLPGATLLWSEVLELGEQKTTDGRKLNTQRVRYRFAFTDINDIRSNHFKFAHYPFGDANIFQFRVDKAMPSPEEVAPERPNINPLANAITNDRYLYLSMSLPNKPGRTNGSNKAWTVVDWQIPINELVATRTPSIVAWAEMPIIPKKNAFEKIWNNLASSDWQNPANFPPQIWLPQLVTETTAQP